LRAQVKNKLKSNPQNRKTSKNFSKSMYNTPKKFLPSYTLQTIDSFLKPVQKFSEISHLNLSGCTLLTGKTLDLIIDYCPSISTLVLMSIKQICDDLTKVPEMQKLVNLTTLNLARSGVSDSKLRLFIDNLPSLKQLSLQGKISRSNR